MRVNIAPGAGFCGGVKRAVDMAVKLAEKYGEIYTVGELVHNELVTEYLKSKRVKCVSPDDIDALKEGDVALIRAHGLEIGLEEKLRAKGVVLYDATCPVVKKNQLLAKERAEAGDEVLIIGDAKHDEVVALKSYAGQSAKVFSPDTLPEISEKNTSILFQTTVLPEKFEKISDFANNFKKNHRNLVVIFNTICYTTKEKQDEARSYAAKTQAVLVLGSLTSANTRRLFEVAKEVNPNVFFVENVSDVLKIKNIKDHESVSIVAGASTPPWLIREVSKLMSETQVQAEIAGENEVKKEATLQEQNPATTNSDNAESVNKPVKEMTMADVLESNRSIGYTNYKVGKRIKGNVISAGEDGIYVNIGGKKDGFIDKSEVSLDGNYDPADYKQGTEIQAVIIAVNKDSVALSKKSIDLVLKEEEEAEKILSGTEFRLKMTEVVKGGLRAHLGPYTIFVPASQIRMGYVKNLEDYKDKELRLVLMPEKDKEQPEKTESDGETVEAAPEQEKPRKKSRYLFASQRMILEREKQEKEDAFWGSLHKHDIVTGKVKRFAPFGAFVSVKGFDCLAHISQLSWNKITDPSTVLKIGESYDFVVLELDRATGRVSLGYRQLQKKPYELAAEKFPIGTVVKGKVERIFPFGAFVSIDDGVDGLVHVSQISHNWIKDANEAFTVGQEVEAKIIGFDDNRITLSIKELLPEPDTTQTAQDEQPVDAEATDEEKAAKRSSRVKRFEKKVAEGENKGEPKKERKPRRNAETSNEPKEWVSGSGTASIGDLFKGLNIDLPDGTEE